MKAELVYEQDLNWSDAVTRLNLARNGQRLHSVRRKECVQEFVMGTVEVSLGGIDRNRLE
jgi:hypothetical protein